VIEFVLLYLSGLQAQKWQAQKWQAQKWQAQAQ
jgi:hypothetical protein